MCSPDSHRHTGSPKGMVLVIMVARIIRIRIIITGLNKVIITRIIKQIKQL